MSEQFKVHYDQSTDVLYLAKAGIEEEVVELHPGINLEIDSHGDLIGIEILNASRVFRPVLQPLTKQVTKRRTARKTSVRA